MARCGHLDDLAHQSPVATYTTNEGLAGNDIFRVFEDRHGDIWIATARTAASPAPTNGLARWQRATGRIERFTEADGLPSLDTHVPQAFVEDASGALWIGWAPAGLLRLTGGRFESIGGGLPAGPIRDLHRDRLGRLWIATSHGLARVAGSNVCPACGCVVGDCSDNHTLDPGINVKFGTQFIS